jgi:hypothetical protein
MSSILRLVRGESERGPIEVDLGGDFITIRLCHEDRKNYALRKGDSSAVLHACVVFPVLVYAVNKLETDDDYKKSQSTWCIRLREMMHKRNLEEKESFIIAQELLRSPVNRGFENLHELMSGNSDD